MPPNNEMKRDTIEYSESDPPKRRRTKVFQFNAEEENEHNETDVFKIGVLPKSPVKQIRPISTDNSRLNFEIQNVQKKRNASSTATPSLSSMRRVNTLSDLQNITPSPNFNVEEEEFHDEIDVFESDHNAEVQLRTPRKTNRSVSTDNLRTYFEMQNAQNAQKRRHVSTTATPFTSGNIPGMRRINTISDFGDIRQQPHQPTPRRKISQISNKNGNMVIQLVLPGNRNSGNFENNTNLPPNNNVGPVMKTRLRHSSSQQDLYSISGNFGNGNPVYYDDGSEYIQQNVSRNVTRSNSVVDTEAENPTPPEEKVYKGREFLSKILSSVYALFIVTLGLVVYISDVAVGSSPLAETFSLYLVVIAFIFLIYLIVDVRIYMHKRNKYLEALRNCQVEEGIELHHFPEGDVHLSIPIQEAAKLQKPLPHYYCLSKGRHSGSFYLKIGAAGFCLGHLVHSGLIVGYQIVFLASDGDAFYECASVATLILDIIYPVYSFFLLFFIFKYSNVIINRHVPLVRFGLMHCIASSICFWIWTILRETMDSLSAKGIDITDYDYDKDTSEEETQRVIYFGPDIPIAMPLTSYNRKGAQQLVGYLNQSLRLFAGKCDGDEGLAIIYKNYSPYLYPFTVEYSILVVGVLFVIWQYIGSCKSKCYAETPESLISDNQASNQGPKESNLVLHADFHSSSKGLFSGIVVIVISVVSIILFFIAVNDDKFLMIGITINNVTNIVFLFIMAVVGLLAYRQITQLDINRHPISLLDDILIFICIPAFFLDAIFSIVPAVTYGSVFSIIFIIIEIIQMLIQTPLIIDGLRRCSNTKELRQKKPGRELITFLIVCNVALWITQTFEVKSAGVQDFRYEFYGKIMWTIIGHMSLPLTMFYRFHSSVCLVDIWKYAYEPASH